MSDADFDSIMRLQRERNAAVASKNSPTAFNLQIQPADASFEMNSAESHEAGPQRHDPSVEHRRFPALIPAENSNLLTAPSGTGLRPQLRPQKRQRATQGQLSILELEFNKSPALSADRREKLAKKINMTELSVQIWFYKQYVP